MTDYDIKEKLNNLAEEKYRIFTSTLIPGQNNILGVRMPHLRRLAKEIAKGDWKTYLHHATTDSYEEIMLQGLVIGYIKADVEEVFSHVKAFIPKIDNWGVCDSFCYGLKITKDHRNFVWEFLKPYLQSDKAYEIRFAVVMLLSYFIQEEYMQQVFQAFNQIHHEDYYVKMAVAWAISMYYIAFPEETKEFYNNNQLDDFTYNKALQKTIESLRLSKEDKDILRQMKRKKS